MTETGSGGTTDNPISGSMLLYEQPQLLAKEDHGHLGLRATAAPFAFARSARAIPLVLSEFRSVQKHCPVVFSGVEEPTPLAIVGLDGDSNLFVDEDGHWSVPGYVPAYLRCYPFALATAVEDRYAVVFDRASDMVSDTPEVPFFDGEELAAPIQERIDFCRSYAAEKQRTQAFCAALVRLGLLASQQANHTVNGEERTIARYHAVDQNKLQALEAETLAELFRDGTLAGIIAHLFSLDTFAELMRRRELRQSSSE